MQILRLNGPSRLLIYLFPDVWLLYRLYVSARAGDQLARDRANEEETIRQKRELEKAERDEALRKRRERKEQERVERHNRLKAEGFTDDELSVFDFDIHAFMRGMHRAPNAAQSGSSVQSQSQATYSNSAATPPREYTKDDLEHDLSTIVGLENVKQSVRDIYAQVTIQKQRIANGLTSPGNQSALHMLFLGNPGTGKTTVARLIGSMFQRMGVLSKGHFVETSPAGLIAGYVGQTRLQTDAKLKEAIGGVLFVDEAYAIIDPENPSANSYGKEAIQVLIKQMEDHRDDLCVIYAGYTNYMGPFVRANPGLESRIAFRLHFDDYSPADLMKIIVKMCDDRNLQFDTQAQEYLRSLFAKNAMQIGSLGNGRWARNVLEAAIRKQSRRLNGKVNSRETLQTLTVQDVVAWEEKNTDASH